MDDNYRYNRFMTIDDKVYLGLVGLLTLWDLYLCLRIGKVAPANFILYSLMAFIGVYIWSTASNVQIRNGWIWLVAIITALLLATPLAIVGVAVELVLVYLYVRRYLTYGAYLNDPDGYRVYLQRKRDEQLRKLAEDQYARGMDVEFDSNGHPLRPLDTPSSGADDYADGYDDEE